MKNKNNQKVSVIIPVYNGEKTLNQCLNSVLNQTYKNYELIVVDNNSTDKTEEIIKEFQKKEKGKNKKIKYLFEAKRGRGAARYRGEINSKGEIILMTDSDCIVPKNWIKEMIEPITKSKQVAVQGIKKPIIVNYWTEHIQRDKEKLIAKLIKNKKGDLLDTANFAIKKSVLKNVGYINSSLVYGEDKELSIKLKIKRYDIYLKRFAVLHYHPDTILKVFKKEFKRGEWNSKIRKRYASQKELFSTTNLTDNLRFIIGFVSELLTLNKSFWYDFVTGTAWRAGLFYGWLKNLKVSSSYPINSKVED